MWGVFEVIRRLRRDKDKDSDPLDRKWILVAVLVLACFLAWWGERKRADELVAMRPYLVQAATAIQQFHDPQTKLVLRTHFVVVLENTNDRPAANLHGSMVLLSNQLDPNQDAVQVRAVDNVNDLGKGKQVSVNSEHVRIGPNNPPMFVYLTMRYADAITRNEFSQSWYAKFVGANPEGLYITALYGVSAAEKEKIDRCIDALKLRGGL